MIIKVFDDKVSLGHGRRASGRRMPFAPAIEKTSRARLIAATGASQFELLDALTSLPGIDWPRVEMFHLDEYIGVAGRSPGQFPELSASAPDRQGGNHAPPSPRRRAGPCRRDPRRGTRAAERSDRRGPGRDRRKRSSRVQRSAGRFRHRGTLSGGDARRRVSAAAARRRLVRESLRRASTSDLDGDSPDSLGARDHRRRARMRERRRRWRHAAKGRSARWRPPRFFARIRTPRSIWTRAPLRCSARRAPLR